MKNGKSKMLNHLFKNDYLRLRGEVSCEGNSDLIN